MSAPAAEPNPAVLIVDDEASSRRPLARALEAAGFQCRQAENGTAALAEIDRELPALLLLDFNMPGLDGAEVCRRVRAHPDGTVAQLPIVMLTGMEGDEQEIHCLESGADDFVTKPVNVAVLRARIGTHLRLRALRQQLEAQNAELARWRTELERDLEAARLTQQAIIPQRLPVLPGWEVAAHYQPVIQVGGDVYDWLPLADGRWLFWIADATGHGAAAALLTALAKLLFRHAAAQSSSPAEILRLVNVDLRQIFRGRPVMTALAIALDPATGQLSVAGAGHPPLLTVCTGDGDGVQVRSQVPPLGLKNTPDPEEETAQVSPGGTLLLLTDGFYGVTDAGGERLEFSDLHGLARAAGRERPGAAGMLEGLVARVQSFAGRDVFPDDLAGLALCRGAADAASTAG